MMTNDKSLTEKSLLTTLKKAGVVTKKDLSDELAEFHFNIVKPDLDKRFNKVDSRLNKVECGLKKVDSRLNKVETELRYVKDEVKGVKVELSNTPSLKQFNQLKTKVERHHPVN